MPQYSDRQVVWQVLAELVDSQPDEPMYYLGDLEVSYKEVDRISDHVACGLLELGMKKGDRIGINGLNTLEWVYTYFAAAKIGACVVGLNVRYRDSELDYILNQSGASVVATIDRMPDLDYGEFFREFRPRIPGVKNFIFFGSGGMEGSTAFQKLVDCPIDQDGLRAAKEAVRPDDPMIIIYTSGTTGKPKGACITNASQLASARAQTEHCQLLPSDTFLGALPFNHVGGITCCLLSALIGGSRVLLIPAPDLEMIITQANRRRLTMVGGVPTLHTLMFMHPAMEQWDRSPVRVVVTGGSNAEPELLTTLTKGYPNATIMNLYGLSETSGAVVLSPPDSSFEQLVASIGKPIGDFRVKVIGPGGEELPQGETGELCFKGGAVCKGYYEMPRESAEAFGGDGWLKTGDMGFVDQDGYILLKGRKKEMYLQGGFNVYPVEVENLLSKHPAVAMVAGIGVPDPVLGEVGRYYIVPKPGAEVSEKEIKEFCAQHLADYKVPRQVVFRQELPMTPVGKIMKVQLKQEYMEQRNS